MHLIDHVASDSTSLRRSAEGRNAAMRWLRDKATWIVLFAAIAATSSSYSAYKIYQMTDGNAAPTKSRR